MKLLSWNLNGRRVAARGQVAAVARRRPDIVTFQEVTEGTIGILRRALIERGLPFAVNTFELQESRSHLVGPRRYGLLIAARVPVEPGRVERLDQDRDARRTSTAGLRGDRRCPESSAEISTAHRRKRRTAK
jgi:hypothetical protein